MLTLDLLFLIVKYVFAIAIFIVLLGAPAWLARQNKKDKLQMGIVRVSSWLFGWTGVGWIYALYLAVRK